MAPMAQMSLNANNAVNGSPETRRSCVTLKPSSGDSELSLIGVVAVADLGDHDVDRKAAPSTQTAGKEIRLVIEFAGGGKSTGGLRKSIFLLDSHYPVTIKAGLRER